MGLNTGLSVGNYPNNGVGSTGYQVPMSSTSSFGNANSGTGNLNPSSLYNGYGSTTDYSNDIMFPQELNMNFNQYSTQGQAAFTGETSNQNQAKIEAAMAQNPDIKVTPNGNLYAETNFCKKAGFLVGTLTAGAKELSKAFKGGKFTKAALNLKSLAVKVPVFAIIGWGIGALVDKFFNSQSAQAADKQAAQQTTRGNLSYNA